MQCVFKRFRDLALPHQWRSSSSPQVQAIKLLVRWLLGMKNNQSKSANSTLRLLSAMLVSEGDLTEQKKIR